MKKNAYITGADRGLGLGLVKILLENNFKVYAGIYMQDQKKIKKVREEHGDDLIIIPLDVSDDKSVSEAAKMISSDTESLNLLINNAGTAKDRSGTILEKQYLEDIRMMFEINTLGPLRVTQSVLELLLNADTKTLVNISSIAGSVGSITRVNQYGYTMSKTALNMQSKLIHNHLKDKGVKVLVIHPGWMRSYIRGDISLMKDAPLEPIDSAREIVKLIQNKNEINDELFMDYQGNTLPW